MISLYIENDSMKQAKQALQKAESKIIKENPKGLFLFLEVKKALFHFASRHKKETAEAINKVENLLTHFPYLREKGIFLIIKGLWLLNCGKRKEAEDAFDQGIHILKQSRFIPHLLYGLHLLHTFLHKRFESEAALRTKYNRMWSQIGHQYHFEELEKETCGQLMPLL
ncbi:hypothetical protein [Aneurinibacillus tyrosinisolvens]|uniref:hypothetical protein n=1 Tax=Aneurinibacillus tyrosinisolvens TaxID=1443435 RepID=UPI00063F0656|nr:hypothetical protein [Aneurinibacillus tyrosinisolvens]